MNAERVVGEGVSKAGRVHRLLDVKLDAGREGTSGPILKTTIREHGITPL